MRFPFPISFSGTRREGGRGDTFSNGGAPLSLIPFLFQILMGRWKGGRGETSSKWKTGAFFYFLSPEGMSGEKEGFRRSPGGKIHFLSKGEEGGEKREEVNTLKGRKGFGRGSRVHVRR